MTKSPDVFSRMQVSEDPVTIYTKTSKLSFIIPFVIYIGSCGSLLTSISLLTDILTSLGPGQYIITLGKKILKTVKGKHVKFTYFCCESVNMQTPFFSLLNLVFC